MGCGSCKDVVKGAAGLAKVAMQGIGVPVDQAPDDVIQRRRDQCRDCEFATRSDKPKFAKFMGMTTKSRCKICTCFIVAKTRLASESCPLPTPRWMPVTGSPARSS